jgi:tartrate dehydrogenase/decarboxylase / D-malate dehydrogenase
MRIRRRDGKLAAREGRFAFRFDHFDWGSDYYKRHGV